MLTYAPSLTADPKLPRDNSQTPRPDKEPPLKPETTLSGNPAVGTVIQYGWIHSIFASLPNGMVSDITDTQERLLRDLQRNKVLVVAGEAVDKTLTPDMNPGGRAAALRGLFIDTLFGDKIPDGPLNEMQRRCLYQFGAVNVYAHLNKNVTVIRTVADASKKEDANAGTESQALRAIMTDYFNNPAFDKTKPGSREVALVLGAVHTLDPKTCADHDLNKSPKVIKLNYADPFRMRIEALERAKTPEEASAAAAQITNIGVEKWATLSETAKIASFGKVAPEVTGRDTMSREAFRDVLLKAAGTSAELQKMITGAFASNSVPFKDLMFREFGPVGPRAGDPGITWGQFAGKEPVPDQSRFKADDPKAVTILTISEGHGPTQEHMLETMKDGMFFASQFGTLTTPRAQILALSKLLVPGTWANKEALRDHLLSSVRRDAADQPDAGVTKEITRRFKANEFPFNKF